MALEHVGAEKYAWEDEDMEASIKMTINCADTTCDTTIDPNRTWYPDGELVITMPYGDTAIHDTSKYKLCWKFAINAMYLDTFIPNFAVKLHVLPGDKTRQESS